MFFQNADISTLQFYQSGADHVEYVFNADGTAGYDLHAMFG